MPGKFITFEGGEGTGKSTQASLLAGRLKGLGIEVVLTREPGGSAGAEVIRHVILSGAAKPLGPDVEAVLFAAARADHLDQVIRPALERGAWVVCDRFVDSTRVYQGALGQVDPRLLRGLERVTIGAAVPDLTVILDIAPEIGLQRARSRGANADRFENEGQDFHEQLRAAYREIAAREPGRCILIDADAAEGKVAEEVWDAVRRRLGSAPVEMAAGVAAR
ncbi:MAG: dTMP kinase [Rhodoplanes sp.]|jgi:dTMP kinase|nr:dTMP kinase [Rhodoplanes sp.]